MNSQNSEDGIFGAGQGNSNGNGKINKGIREAHRDLDPILTAIRSSL